MPALAVDLQGTRLGRGAGFYDRSLPYATPQTPLVALLHDGELVEEELPFDEHDVPMTAAITPTGGLVQISRS